MDMLEVLGFAAGLMIALSSLPQFLKSLKTKSTGDISISWLLVNMFGQVLWIIYGYYKESLSLMVMSAIALCMVGSVLWLKIKYK